MIGITVAGGTRIVNDSTAAKFGLRNGARIDDPELLREIIEDDYAVERKRLAEKHRDDS
jgi:hypothetical protein